MTYPYQKFTCQGCGITYETDTLPEGQELCPDCKKKSVKPKKEKERCRLKV